MGTVGCRLRAELRRSWRSALVPWWWAALAAPVAVLVADVPDRWAARTSPAATLRQE